MRTHRSPLSPPEAPERATLFHPEAATPHSGLRLAVAARSRQPPLVLHRSRATIEDMAWRPATLVVPLFPTATSGRDRILAMPPKRSW